jgi:NAD(P)-dependent dehydrogenase (short-subunit alcohol dehydrogenase family)
MKKLENKTAIVTGGTTGIGYATVSALTSLGAKVLFTGRNQDRVVAAAKQLGATGIVSNQGDLSQIEQLVQITADTLGKVDILVVNAGIFLVVPFESVTEEFYDNMMNVNQKGIYFTIQKFLPILNENASIVLISAAGSQSAGARGASVYYLTRAAINSMARTLCIELAPRGIRVNAILPAAIDTPIFDKMGLPDEVLDNVIGTLKEKLPVKRMGTATDIAHLVTFLASDNAAFITGAEYMIDGGLSRNPPI